MIDVIFFLSYNFMTMKPNKLKEVKMCKFRYPIKTVCAGRISTDYNSEPSTVNKQYVAEYISTHFEIQVNQ